MVNSFVSLSLSLSLARNSLLARDQEPPWLRPRIHVVDGARVVRGQALLAREQGRHPQGEVSDTLPRRHCVSLGTAPAAIYRFYHPNDCNHYNVIINNKSARVVHVDHSRIHKYQNTLSVVPPSTTAIQQTLRHDRIRPSHSPSPIRCRCILRPSLERNAASSGSVVASFPAAATTKPNRLERENGVRAIVNHSPPSRAITCASSLSLSLAAVSGVQRVLLLPVVIVLIVIIERRNSRKRHDEPSQRSCVNGVGDCELVRSHTTPRHAVLRWP